MRLLLGFVSLLCNCYVASGQANESNLIIGDPKFTGSGCGGADVELITTSDGDQIQLRVTFQGPFRIEGSRRRARVTCNGAIPLTIASEKAVGVRQELASGLVVVSPTENGSSYAEVSTKIFFNPGDEEVHTRKRFDLSGSEQFVLATPTSTVWSECGESVILRINTALLAVGGEETNISVDSMDNNSGGFVYTLELKDCELVR